MSMVTINGCRLSYEVSGRGEMPLVLVHGSWLARRQWDLTIPLLEDSFRVLTYDRRGHSESERPNGKVSVRDHAADLAGLIEHLQFAPAWVIGNSFGGSITLRLAGERPDLLRGIAVHEPPLFSLVPTDDDAAPSVEEDMRNDAAAAERVASGDPAGAAEQFAEAVSPGMWLETPPEIRQTMTENAPGFLADWSDPDFYAFDLARARKFVQPALLTQGDQSPPQYVPVITRLGAALPSVEVQTLPGVGHVPHMEDPEGYVEAVADFFRKRAT